MSKHWLGSLLWWSSLAFSLAISVVSGSAHAIGANPSHDWRSFDTRHFVVHYEAANRTQAETAAAIAEAALPKISAAFQWQPEDRIEIILMDDYDVANGFATPLPFNHTGIFLTPPDDGELLENSDWLTLVLTHELTHIVHLDKVRGAPKFLQNIFGRYPLLFPNAWQPTWLIEGLATYVESDPTQHRGRLDNAMFDAYMRLEVQAGVKSLREINSDGRAFPINKAYLYGAYFFRFLHERYGEPAVFRQVNDYSDNIIPFRVHSNPVAATGKQMDALWLEYQQWLQQRFAGAVKPATGTPLLAQTTWQLDTPVASQDGSVYAVKDDGVQRPQLIRLTAGNAEKALLTVQSGARIDVNAAQEVLIAQPEICDNYHYYSDLYRWSEREGKTRLTTCGRYRFAAWQGADHLIAVHNNSGRAELVQLTRAGVRVRTLYQAQPAEVIPALAVSPDGQSLAFVSKQNGYWRLQEMPIAGGEIQTRVSSAAPLLSPRYAGTPGAGSTANTETDLLFVQDSAGVFNAVRWQRASNQLLQLTESNGAVLAITSAQADQIVTLELVGGGYQLFRQSLPTVAAMSPTTVPDSATATTVIAIEATEATEPTDANPTAPSAVASAVSISNERDYSALETLAPRAWFPTGFSGDGALAFGVELFGQDAVGWHQYTLSPQYEVTEGELLGSAVYGYDQRHFLALFREMEVTSTVENDDDEDEIATYEVRTTGQWVSLLPWLRLDHRMHFGVGAASAREVYHAADGSRAELQDEKVAAAFVSYDSRRSNWWSEGNNSGQLFSVLAESYDPFDGQYEGRVYRADWRGLFALGPTTLALRLTEARGHDGTEPFELGGSFNSEHIGIPRLNERDLALRGYENGTPALTGKNARIGGIEWRTPLADIDRHFMVPPIGINRLSAALFYEAGGTWSGSGSPDQYYRSAGIELLAELKLGYRLGLLVRAGFARGLDQPGGDEAYLQFGRSF